ncbi:acyl-CoA dehydrogenase family protein [Erythrobacter sp.]|jgi:alkylation response protein AidB-like acyl-CoA dehydrogenase|uniref:acyl-CoA dehydrogenase family protein n=1 Tax=Erythrobacter sp. TaxID=1042 RepID=UPI002EC1C477|nr:acyl-CoA dehydrogenase family protein [Erythrobacter sp.]
MDIDFTPQDEAFREEVRAFLDDKLSDRLRDGARRTPGVFVEPDIGLEWQRILNEKGWLASHWPEEDGGTGWTPVQRYIFEKECALAGAPGLSVLGLKLIGPVLCEFGTPEQKERFLPRILSGEDYWCQGYSEPGSGSDLASLKTRAVREGDEYRVDGSKIWTTHAHYANWMFCLVRTDSETSQQKGISFLLIPMEQDGISVTPIVTLAGDHEVNQVFLEDARSDASNLVGEEGQGWTIAKFLLENERGGSAHAPRLLADIAKLRRRLDEEPSGTNGALGQDPVWTRDLAKLKLKAEALEFTELRILAELAKGRRPGPQTSLVKLVAANLRQDVDTFAMNLAGPDGLQLPAQRPLYGNEAPEPVGTVDDQLAAGRYLNSRAWTIFGGSDEVQKNIIAKTVLRL